MIVLFQEEGGIQYVRATRSPEILKDFFFFFSPGGPFSPVHTPAFCENIFLFYFGLGILTTLENKNSTAFF